MPIASGLTAGGIQNRWAHSSQRFCSKPRATHKQQVCKTCRPEKEQSSPKRLTRSGLSTVATTRMKLSLQQYQAVKRSTLNAFSHSTQSTTKKSRSGGEYEKEFRCVRFTVGRLLLCVGSERFTTGLPGCCRLSRFFGLGG